MMTMTRRVSLRDRFANVILGDGDGCKPLLIAAFRLLVVFTRSGRAFEEHALRFGVRQQKR